MKKILFTFFSFFILVFSVYAYTEAPIDVTTMSALELEDALDKGYITSEQLVTMYLERIEAYDDQFNAINQINEKAIEQAKELDEERKNGKVRSKLHGIPIIVKCNIDVEGMPTTAGASALSDNMPNDNAFAVQKLIDAGAIVIASANMSEFAYDAGFSYSSYGYVRNVFNLDYTPYGSSGGSAVAVTAGFAAAALGTDTNCSVRLPAMGAGLVGIRPKLGNVSRTGVIPYDVTRDTIGVLSKTVEDNALILSIIEGEDDDDSYTTGASVVNGEIEDNSLEGVTIGVPTQYLTGSSAFSGVLSLTNNEIKALAEEQIKKLEEAGATIVYIDYFVKTSNLTIASSTMHGITMCDGFNDYIQGTTGTIRSFKQLVYSNGHVQYLGGLLGGCGGNYSSDAYLNEQKKSYKEYVESIFEDKNLDVILYPTVKLQTGAYSGGTGANAPGGSLPSVLGYPAITVPMGKINGLNYNIEFMSIGDENILYEVASAYESLSGVGISSTELAPSLYTIPENVTKLKELYEKDYDNKLRSDWIDEVRTFFTNYNNIDDKDASAKELIDKYNDFGIEEVIKSSSSNSIFKKICLLIIIIVVLRIIYVKIMNKILRKKRKKKSRR